MISGNTNKDYFGKQKIIGLNSQNKNNLLDNMDPFSNDLNSKGMSQPPKHLIISYVAQIRLIMNDQSSFNNVMSSSSPFGGNEDQGERVYTVKP